MIRPALVLPLVLPLVLALAALPASAQTEPAQTEPAQTEPAQTEPAQTDPALGPEAFETMVEGKTFDTHNSSGRYGVETFLPGRRAIWRDAEQCLEGTWRVDGEMICFDYIGEPFPHCWTYHDRGRWLMGWYWGDRGTDPIMLIPSPEVVTCEGWFGA